MPPAHRASQSLVKSLRLFQPGAGFRFGAIQFAQRATPKSGPDINDVVLRTEEEDVGVVSGAWLDGQRAVPLMQSGGVGTYVTPMASRCGS